MRAVLVIECPDRPGIVAAISSFLAARAVRWRGGERVLVHGNDTVVFA